MPLTITIPYGTLLALHADDPWPTWAPEVTPVRWHEATLPARRDARPLGVRRVAYRSACQTASGGSFVVLLGATFAPDDGDSLRVRVAEAGDDLDALGPWLATPMFARVCAALAGADLAAGALTLDRGRVHPVDTKVWRHERGAAELALLLCAHAWHDEATLRAAYEASRDRAIS